MGVGGRLVASADSDEAEGQPAGRTVLSREEVCRRLLSHCALTRGPSLAQWLPVGPGKADGPGREDSLELAG